MSNSILDLESKEDRYISGHHGSTRVHDAEGVATLRDILVELRKMNIHLSYMSGIDVENYNIEDSD